MERRRGWTMLGWALVLALTGPGAAAAQMGMMGGMGHGMMGMGMMGGMGAGMAGHRWLSPLAFKEALKLTDEQVTRLEKLQYQYQKKTIALKARIRVAEVELAELVQGKSLDLKAVEKKVREIEKLRADLRIYRYQILAKKRGILTDAQYRKYRELYRQRRMGYGMPGMRGPGMMMGPGMMGPGGWGMGPGGSMVPGPVQERNR